MNVQLKRTLILCLTLFCLLSITVLSASAVIYFDGVIAEVDDKEQAKSQAIAEGMKYSYTEGDDTYYVSELVAGKTLVDLGTPGATAEVTLTVDGATYTVVTTRVETLLALELGAEAKVNGAYYTDLAAADAAALAAGLGYRVQNGDIANYVAKPQTGELHVDLSATGTTYNVDVTLDGVMHTVKTDKTADEVAAELGAKAFFDGAYYSDVATADAAALDEGLSYRVDGTIATYVTAPFAGGAVVDLVNTTDATAKTVTIDGVTYTVTTGKLETLLAYGLGARAYFDQYYADVADADAAAMATHPYRLDGDIATYFAKPETGNLHIDVSATGTTYNVDITLDGSMYTIKTDKERDALAADLGAVAYANGAYYTNADAALQAAKDAGAKFFYTENGLTYYSAYYEDGKTLTELNASGEATAVTVTIEGADYTVITDKSADELAYLLDARAFFSQYYFSVANADEAAKTTHPYRVNGDIATYAAAPVAGKTVVDLTATGETQEVSFTVDGATYTVVTDKDRDEFLDGFNPVATLNGAYYTDLDAADAAAIAAGLAFRVNGTVATYTNAPVAGGTVVDLNATGSTSTHSITVNGTAYTVVTDKTADALAITLGAVARVNDTTVYYTTLVDAFTGAASDSTIYLLTDITANSSSKPAGKTLTLTGVDLGGTYPTVTHTGGYLFDVAVGSNLTVKNLNVNTVGKIAWATGAITFGENVNITGTLTSTLFGWNKGTVTLATGTNVTLTSDTNGDGPITVAADATLVIDGATVTLTGEGKDAVHNKGTLRFNGGSLTFSKGGDGIENTGKLIVDGGATVKRTDSGLLLYQNKGTALIKNATLTGDYYDNGGASATYLIGANAIWGAKKASIYYDKEAILANFATYIDTAPTATTATLPDGSEAQVYSSPLYYASIDEAVKALTTDGQTIVLIKSYTQSASIAKGNNKTYTLTSTDKDNIVLTAGGNWLFDIGAGNSNYVILTNIKINLGAKNLGYFSNPNGIVIDAGTYITGSGMDADKGLIYGQKNASKITVKAGATIVATGSYPIFGAENATVLIEGGTFEGALIAKAINASTLTIKGGTFNATKLVSASGSATVTFAGGTFNGGMFVEASESVKVVINNGTFNFTTGSDVRGFYLKGTSTAFEMNGGKINATNAASNNVMRLEGSATFTGGEIDVTAANNNPVRLSSASTISGGTFKSAAVQGFFYIVGATVDVTGGSYSASGTGAIFQLGEAAGQLNLAGGTLVHYGEGNMIHYGHAGTKVLVTGTATLIHEGPAANYIFNRAGGAVKVDGEGVKLVARGNNYIFENGYQTKIAGFCDDEKLHITGAYLSTERADAAIVADDPGYFVFNNVTLDSDTIASALTGHDDNNGTATSTRYAAARVGGAKEITIPATKNNSEVTKTVYTGYYGTFLDAAKTVADTTATVYVVNNCSLARKALTITGNVTVELNGYTITADEANDVLFNVAENATLTLLNGTVKASNRLAAVYGTLNLGDDTDGEAFVAVDPEKITTNMFLVYGAGVLNVNKNATLRTTATASVGKENYIMLQSSFSGAVNVYGTIELNHTTTGAYKMFRANSAAGGSVNVYDGATLTYGCNTTTASDENAIFYNYDCADFTYNIYGGTFTVSSSGAAGTFLYKGALNISGGTFNSTGSSSKNIYVYGSTAVSITGGEFTASAGNADTNVQLETSAAFTISDATFTHNGTGSCLSIKNGTNNVNITGNTTIIHNGTASTSNIALNRGGGNKVIVDGADANLTISAPNGAYLLRTAYYVTLSNLTLNGTTATMGSVGGEDGYMVFDNVKIPSAELGEKWLATTMVTCDGVTKAFTDPVKAVAYLNTLGAKAITLSLGENVKFERKAYTFTEGINLTIDGRGHRMEVNGSNATYLFKVQAGRTMTLKNLEVWHCPTKFAEVAGNLYITEGSSITAWAAASGITETTPVLLIWGSGNITLDAGCTIATAYKDGTVVDGEPNLSGKIESYYLIQSNADWKGSMTINGTMSQGWNAAGQWSAILRLNSGGIGKINIGATAVLEDTAAAGCTGGNAMIISDATVTFNVADGATFTCTNYPVLRVTNGKATVIGGTFTNNRTTNLFEAGAGELVIESGTFDGGNFVYSTGSSKVTVGGGTFNLTTGGTRILWAYGASSTLTINGGTFNGLGAASSNVIRADGTFNMTDGTVEVTAVKNNPIRISGVATISGGTFINGTGYDFFYVCEDGALTVNNGTFTATNRGMILTGEQTSGKTIKVTINGGEWTLNTTANANLINLAAGELSITGGTFDATTPNNAIRVAATATITGGTFTNRSGTEFFYCTSSAAVTMSGITFNGTAKGGIVYADGNANVTITSGTITSADGGTFYLSGNARVTVGADVTIDAKISTKENFIFQPTGYGVLTFNGTTINLEANNASAWGNIALFQIHGDATAIFNGATVTVNGNAQDIVHNYGTMKIVGGTTFDFTNGGDGIENKKMLIIEDSTVATTGSNLALYNNNATTYVVNSTVTGRYTVNSAASSLIYVVEGSSFAGVAGNAYSFFDASSMANRVAKTSAATASTVLLHDGTSATVYNHHYNNLSNAIKAANAVADETATVYVLSNCSLARKAVTITGNVTVELNGYTVTAAEANDVLFNVSEGATLTLLNGTVKASNRLAYVYGTLNLGDDTEGEAFVAIDPEKITMNMFLMYDAGVLNVNKNATLRTTTAASVGAANYISLEGTSTGTVNVYGTIDLNHAVTGNYKMFRFMNGSTGTVNVYDGAVLTYNCVPSAASNEHAVFYNYDCANATYNIYGGTISNTSGKGVLFFLYKGTVNVSGGTLSSNGAYGVYAYGTAALNVSGGTFNATGASTLMVYMHGTSVPGFTGGTFTASSETNSSVLYLTTTVAYTLSNITVTHNGTGVALLINNSKSNVNITGNTTITHNGTASTSNIALNRGGGSKVIVDGADATLTISAPNGAYLLRTAYYVTLSNLTLNGTCATMGTKTDEDGYMVFDNVKIPSVELGEKWLATTMVTCDGVTKAFTDPVKAIAYLNTLGAKDITLSLGENVKFERKAYTFTSGINLTIDGRGHRMEVNGSNATYLFKVQADRTMTLKNLEVWHCPSKFAEVAGNLYITEGSSITAWAAASGITETTPVLLIWGNGNITLDAGCTIATAYKDGTVVDGEPNLSGKIESYYLIQSNADWKGSITINGTMSQGWNAKGQWSAILRLGKGGIGTINIGATAVLEDTAAAGCAGGNGLIISDATITLNVADGATFTCPNYSIFRITGGKFTVNGGTINNNRTGTLFDVNGSGALVIKSGTFGGGNFIVTGSTSSVTIDGGTFNLTTDGTRAIWTGGSTTLTINGGTFNGLGAKSSNVIRIDGPATINDITVNVTAVGNNPIRIKGNTVVNGGTYTHSAGTNGFFYVAEAGVATFNGGTYTTTRGAMLLTGEQTSGKTISVTITGGDWTINNTLAKADGGNVNLITLNVGEMAITGGTFKGLATYNNIIRVATKATVSGATMTSSVASYFFYVPKGNVTFGEGNVFTTTTKAGIAQIDQSATITFTGGTYTVPSNGQLVNPSASTVTFNDGTFNGGCFLVTSGACAVTVNGGTFNFAGASGIRGFYTGAASSLTMNGGTFNANGSASSNPIRADGTFIMTDGTINVTACKNNPIRFSGEATISGGTFKNATGYGFFYVCEDAVVEFAGGNYSYTAGSMVQTGEQTSGKTIKITVSGGNWSTTAAGLMFNHTVGELTISGGTLEGRNIVKSTGSAKTTLTGNAVINFKGTDKSNDRGFYAASGTAAIVISGGTFNALTATASNAIRADGPFTMTGGTINVTAAGNNPIRVSNVATINGGTFVSAAKQGMIYGVGATLTITGGSFSADNSGAILQLGETGSTVNVKGGTFQHTGKASTSAILYVTGENAMTVKLSGANTTFQSAMPAIRSENASAAVTIDGIALISYAKLYEGKFGSIKVQSIALAGDNVAVKNGAVIRINDQKVGNGSAAHNFKTGYYFDLASALAAAKNGDVLYVLESMTLAPNSVRVTAKDITLAGAKDGIVITAKDVSDYLFYVVDGGSLTVENLTIKANGNGVAIRATSDASAPSVFTLGADAKLYGERIDAQTLIYVYGGKYANVNVDGTVGFGKNDGTPELLGCEANAYVIRAKKDGFQGTITVTGTVYNLLTKKTPDWHHLFRMEDATGKLMLDGATLIHMLAPHAEYTTTNAIIWNDGITVMKDSTFITNVNAFYNSVGTPVVKIENCDFSKVGNAIKASSSNAGCDFMDDISASVFGYCFRVGDTYYKTIADAIKALPKADAESYVSATIYVTGGTTSGTGTIDGNYDITLKGAYEGATLTETGGWLLTVKNGASLTVEGINFVTNGALFNYTAGDRNGNFVIRDSVITGAGTMSGSVIAVGGNAHFVMEESVIMDTTGSKATAQVQLFEALASFTGVADIYGDLTNGAAGAYNHKVVRTSSTAGVINVHGTATLTYNCPNPANSDEAAILYNYASTTNAVINVLGATINHNAPGGKVSYICNGATLNIYNATVKSASQPFTLQGRGNVNVYGGDFTFGGESVFNNAGALTIYGGSFHFAGESVTVDAAGGVSALLGYVANGESSTGVLNAAGVAPAVVDGEVKLLLTATLTSSAYADMKALADNGAVTFGVLVVPTAALNGSFNHAALAGSDYVDVKAEGDAVTVAANGDVTVAIAIGDLDATTAYSAIFYATYTVNGATVYSYSGYTAENSTTVASVAAAALADVSATPDGYDYCYKVAEGVFSRYDRADREILALYAAAN